MWNKKNLVLAVILNIFIAVFPLANVWPDEEPPAGDETATFSSINAPDALIILDLTGSMNTSPPNEFVCDSTSRPYLYGHDSSCDPDTVNCGCTGTPSCY
jgi:hypothetical protein